MLNLNVVNVVKKRNQSFLNQIIISLLFIFISIFIKVWVPAIGRGAPYLIFTTAVIASAWFGGLVSGILTTFVTAIFALFFFVGSGSFSADPLSSLQAGIFVCEGLLFSVLINRSRDAEEKLSLSSALLSKIFSRIKDTAIVVLNDKGQVINWSNSALELTGYSISQTVGKHFSFLYTHEEKKQGVTKREIKYAFRQRELQEKNWIVTSKGVKLFVHDETLPIADEKGKTSLIIKILKLLPKKENSLEQKTSNPLPPSFIPTIIHA